MDRLQSAAPSEHRESFDVRQKVVMIWVRRAALALFPLLLAAQLIRPATLNPPLNPAHEIAAHLAVSPAVQVILERSCNDCHSNRTVWPWYSHVAPISWLVASDVSGGRRHVNFSEWTGYPAEKRAKLLEQICKEVQEGDMPPLQYLPMHRAAWLAKADRQRVCDWTAAARQSQTAMDAK